MSGVPRKTEVTTIDGTPEKRMFWSIISDYDLNTGVCELVDNAVDLWISTPKRKPLIIDVSLDAERQLISVSDNAGGVRESELRLLVAPGGSRNDPDAEVIGIFGVGSKRAGIALGESVEIRTRHGRDKTLGIDIDPDWLASGSWEMAGYEFPEIAPGTTEVHISRLRKVLRGEQIGRLRTHLSETYANFLSDDCVIRLNGISIAPILFDQWAFPPDQEPRQVELNFNHQGSGVHVTITGGLITNRDPDNENYGCYFYCNDRLIVKDLKSREVGYFSSSDAGVPHPDASLSRIIVEISGPARMMPWNSSKSGINYGHPIFEDLRPFLVQLNSHFSKLSRRTKDDWQNKVFRFETGNIENVEIPADPHKTKIVLPPLPKIYKAHTETLKSRNASKLREQPWTLGLVEAIGAVEAISKQRLQTKNRISLILLDSTFEIALKEFIVHNATLFPPRTYNQARLTSLFLHRPDVISEITNHIAIPQQLIHRSNHYYNIRNKFIHERATTDVSDADITNYKDVVQRILTILFQLRFVQS